MLYLIGLGLGNEKDISVKGLEVVKKCDKIYDQLSIWATTIKIIKLFAVAILAVLTMNADEFIKLWIRM